MNELESLFFYIIVYLVSAFLLYISKENVLFFFLSVAVVSVLAGLRGNVGTDYVNYSYMYEQFIDANLLVFVRNFSGSSIGLLFLAKIANLFGGVHVFFGLIGACVALPAFYYIKLKFRGNDIFIAAFIFLCTVFTSGLNISKQCVAISFVILSSYYVEKNKYVKYFFCIGVAVMFHITAICALPIFLMFKKHNKFSLLRVFIVVLVLLSMLFINKILSILGGKFEAYIEYDGGVSNRILLLNIAMLVFFFLLRKQAKKQSSNYGDYLYVFFIGCILLLLGFSSPYIKRIALYFTSFDFVLLTLSTRVLKEKERVVFRLGAFTYSISLFILTFFVLGHSDVIPYTFFWM